MSTMSGIEEPSDRIFLNYLKEISQSYRILPKALRLRCEKWVEKLTQTGSNPTWKKHRNSYARLLLNMIMTKQLTDPFHTNPPDGPLPTFPTHLKCHLKDMMGAHESSFWRDLFAQVAADPLRTPSSSKTGGPDFYNPNTREVQDLAMLVKEQEKRIELLEQQLHDERLQHELQLQRQVFNSRVELEKLRKTTQSYSDVINQSVTGSFDAGRSFATTDPARHDNGFSGGSVSRSRDRDGDREARTSFVNTSLSRSQELNEALARASIDSSNFNTIRPPKHASPSSSLDMAKQKSAPAVPIPAFDYLQKEIHSTVHRNKHVTISENENDVRNSAESYRNHVHDQEQDHEEEEDSRPNPIRYSKMNSSSSSSSTDISRHVNTSSSDATFVQPSSSSSQTTINNSSNSAVGAPNRTGLSFNNSKNDKLHGSDDDFMSYIENFQREVRNMQISSPMDPKK